MCDSLEGFRGLGLYVTLPTIAGGGLIGPRILFIIDHTIHLKLKVKFDKKIHFLTMQWQFLQNKFYNIFLKYKKKLVDVFYKQIFIWYITEHYNL